MIECDFIGCDKEAVNVFCQEHECPECEGEGQTECKSCGHIEECLKCNGRGYIEPAEEL